MELSVESIVAIIGLLVAFPPAVLIVWHCCKRCRLQTKVKALPEPESRRFAASGFDTAPPQPRLPFHASSVSLSYEARIVIDQGDSKQCVGLHNSMSLQNSRQPNGVEV
ncbi:hypothetical protein F5X98DRAFT_211227 [Xylaria grammica]|nr:hypothetical protein F5X98DRAFT_211227 [Xylaria grammica]